MEKLEGSGGKASKTGTTCPSENLNQHPLDMLLPSINILIILRVPHFNSHGIVTAKYQFTPDKIFNLNKTGGTTVQIQKWLLLLLERNLWVPSYLEKDANLLLLFMSCVLQVMLWLRC